LVGLISIMRMISFYDHRPPLRLPPPN